MPTVTGTAEGNSAVTLYVDGKSVGAVTADSNGEWSYTFSSALVEGSHSIKVDATDTAGNVSAQSSATSVTIDTTAPSAISIVRAAGPAGAGALNYTVTFSAPVSGVDASDFTLTTTGNASGRVAGVTQVDDHTYMVTVNDVQGAGTLKVSLDGAGTGIVDRAGNALTSGITSDAFTLQDVPPVILAPPPGISDGARPGISGAAASRPASGILAASGGSPSTLEHVRAPTSLGSYGEQGVVHAPVLVPMGSEIQLSEGSSFEVPVSVWSGMDVSQWSVAELRSLNGDPVPEWLHLDDVSGTIQGNAPEGFHGTLRLEVTVTDSAGVHHAGIVQLHFGDASQHAQPSPAQKPEASAVRAKPDLATQFSRHARTAPISAEAARALHQLHTRSARHVSAASRQTATPVAASRG